MLYRMYCCFLKNSVTIQNSSISVRNFALNCKKLNRYTRESLRERLYQKKEHLKNLQSQKNSNQVDSIPLRPHRDLILAFGFTITSGIAFYYISAYAEIKKLQKEIQKRFNVENLFVDFKRFLIDDYKNIKLEKFFDNPQSIFNQLQPAQKCLAVITILNVMVTLAWKIKAIQPKMWRYFTNSYASKSLCLPMFLSVFSHKALLHLALNMYVLWSFAPASINKFLGMEQFLAFYATGGIVSSLLSLTHKSIVKSSVRALGASGAILAVLVYTCMKIPNARLSIIFLPMFQFSAESAVYGIILFDFIGMVFGFRIFDHAAHLGGALFGLFYALYGEEIYKKHFRPFVFKIFSKKQN